MSEEKIKLLEQQVAVLRNDTAAGMQKLYTEVAEMLTRALVRIGKDVEDIDNRIKVLEGKSTAKIRDTKGTEL